MDDAQRPERNLEVPADSEQNGDCGEADMRHRHLGLTEMTWMDWKQDSSKQSWDSDSTKLSYLVRVAGSGGEQVMLFCTSIFVDWHLRLPRIYMSIVAGRPVLDGNSCVKLLCRWDRTWTCFHCCGCFVFIVDMIICYLPVGSFTDFTFLPDNNYNNGKSSEIGQGNLLYCGSQVFQA